ncbi:hypothetical protein CDCA_CDCA09G2804 [Cyanidium caldarium]|uniref:Membrane-associated protein n=1 Tax=Cyanidium caldarium TaxID=2771 RepID=A0AAV9IXE8_CYACA|nr:hypothetical protein CDCA_CDCA09G2804 [Cyanidium caldarium]
MHSSPSFTGGRAWLRWALFALFVCSALSGASAVSVPEVARASTSMAMFSFDDAFFYWGAVDLSCKKMQLACTKTSTPGTYTMCETSMQSCNFQNMSTFATEPTAPPTFDFHTNVIQWGTKYMFCFNSTLTCDTTSPPTGFQYTSCKGPAIKCTLLEAAM